MTKQPKKIYIHELKGVKQIEALKLWSIVKAAKHEGAEEVHIKFGPVDVIRITHLYQEPQNVKVNVQKAK